MVEACYITFIANQFNQLIYYVRLGSLLEFIQKDVMYYVKTTSGYTPMLKFDTDTQSNLMYLEEQFQTSVDPSICIVNRNLVFEDATYNLGLKANPVVPESFDLTIPGIDAQYGQIMNIYVAMDWVLTKLDELKEASTNKVVLIDFLTTICDGINGALGGISRLEPTIDENTNTVIIRDMNPLPYQDEVIKYLNTQGYKIPTNLAEFNLYGYNNTEGSFIKDFSFTTEISPALSTMITVGATANSEVVGENATAFSKFNDGLRDRFKETIVQGDSINNPDPNADQEEFDAITQRYKDSLAEYFTYLDNLEGRNFSPEEGSAYSDLLFNVITYQQQFREAVSKKGKIIVGSPVAQDKANKNLAVSTGFIPFNMSLTMDGLSGMKIYNKFLVETSYLPAN